MRRPYFLIALPIVLVALGVSGLFRTVLAPATPTTDAAVHAVLFWTPGCSACEQVLTEVLPPLEVQYGPQLQVQRVELASIEDFDALFQAAGQGYGLPVDDIGVPFLVIGDRALVGSEAIADNLAQAVGEGLASGGIPAPVLPAELAELVDRSAVEGTVNSEDACGLQSTACAPEE